MTLFGTKNLGQLGENLATQFLKRHNFEIIDRNYRKKWGEIDIVAKNNGLLHFVEVKTVGQEPKNLTPGHYDDYDYEAEERVTFWKRKRLGRAIQTYLLEKRISEEEPYQVDVVAIYLDRRNKKARIRLVQDVEL